MIVFWNGISFMWALGALAFLAVVFFVRAWTGYKRLPLEAENDYNYRLAQKLTPATTDKAHYIKAYSRANAPRVSAYFAATLAAITVLTFPVFALINLGLFWLWKLSGESRVFEPGYLVWGFFIFFLLIGSWAAIGAAGARAFHKNAPGSMRDELIKARAEN